MPAVDVSRDDFTINVLGLQSSGLSCSNSTYCLTQSGVGGLYKVLLKVLKSVSHSWRVFKQYALAEGLPALLN